MHKAQKMRCVIKAMRAPRRPAPRCGYHPSADHGHPRRRPPEGQREGIGGGGPGLGSLDEARTVAQRIAR